MAKKTNDAPISNQANKTPAHPTKGNPTAATNSKNPGQNPGRTPGHEPGLEKDRKNPSFSHGPVTSLDLERARKELEKNRIEYKVEKGELYTVDNGDAATRSTAIKLVNGSRRKAG